MDKTTQDMKVGPLNSDYTRGYLDGKKAGATAVYERAQKMADALRGLLEWHNTALGYGLGRRIETAKEALEQWKGTGKEVGNDK